MIRWAAENQLFWLLAIIPVWAFSRWLIHRRQQRLDRLVKQNLWPEMLPTYSVYRLRLKNFLRLLALAFAVIALARPQWGFRWEEVKQRGLSIIVALDTSKSMLAQDIKPNRLQQAKWGIRDLAKQLKGDRIGLVAFSGDAFLQCPATIDYAAFLMTLDDVYAGIVPLGGTDLERALKTAMESFKKEKDDAADKVIVLISDGESTTGDPMKLIPALKKAGIRVFSIGVGTKEGELIQTSNGFVKDQKGNVVKSSLKEDALERIALGTGGFYVRSASGDFGLERVYKQGIAKLQRAEHQSRMAKIWHERFPWFIGISMLLLLLEAFVHPSTPNREKISGKKRAGALALMILFLLPLAVHAEETPRSAMHKGLKAYRAGDYTNAVDYLEKTALEFPFIGHYDLGNAYYRLQEYEKAEKAFMEALRSPDLGLQAKAYFNLGNTYLARTTKLTDPSQIALAAELAFKAEDNYEKAMRLAPEDVAAKQNFERARSLRIDLEFNRGKWLYDQAEELLKKFKAKDAQKNYQAAKTQFERILRDIEPNENRAKQYLANTEQKLEMLRLAVEQTKKDLQTALQYIHDYQYIMAANLLSKESDERKYAFDLDPELKKKFEETMKKDQQVLEIIKKTETQKLNQAK